MKDIRARILNRTIPVILPPTTSRGFGAGATNAPQSDWVPRRMQPAPEQWLVELADRTSARIVAALGAHPEIIGAGKRHGNARPRVAAAVQRGRS